MKIAVLLGVWGAMKQRTVLRGPQGPGPGESVNRGGMDLEHLSGSFN
jgi:hypothetical protein